MAEQFSDATSQPATPTAEAYSAALLPFVEELEPPRWFDELHAAAWLREQLVPAVAADPGPPGLALGTTILLRHMVRNPDQWTLWCSLASMIERGEPETELLAREQQIGLDGVGPLTRGLVEAVRLAAASRLPAPIVGATAELLDELDLAEVDREPMVLGEPTEELTETAQAMIDAGLAFDGAACARSEVHPLLQSLSVSHASYMARACRGGHQRFNQRFAAVLKRFGYSARCSEIAARSWRRQANDPLSVVAAEMFTSWRQSPGHWSVASVRHDAIGCEMAQGRNGVWYAALIAVDETTEDERQAQRPTLRAA